MPFQQHDRRRWAKDTDRSTCTLCDVAFSVTIRRHHCRSCGEIFCERCCAAQPTRLPVATYDNHKPLLNDAKPVRVCKSCLAVCQEAEREAAQWAQWPFSPLATYTAAMVSDSADWKVRVQRCITKSSNLLAIDLPRLTASFQTATSNGSWSKGATSNGSFTAAAPPSKTMNGAASLDGFYATSNESHIRSIQYLMDEVSATALGFRKIFSRRSLTAFYLEFVKHVTALLVHSLLLHEHEGRDAAVRRFAPLNDLPVGVELRVPSHLAPAILRRESFRLPPERLMTSTKESDALLGAARQQCDRLEGIAERVAVAVTLRYQEQIVCLVEAAATTLATSAASRMHHWVDRHSEESEGDALRRLMLRTPLEEVVCSALLHERPAWAHEKPLQTRIGMIDTHWTDHGALSCCGLVTPDHNYYEPLYSCAAAEMNPAYHLDHQRDMSVTSPSLPLPVTEGSRLVHSSHLPPLGAGKYYYRRGSCEEATQCRMLRCGPTRRAPNPIWSADMLQMEYLSLVHCREGVLSRYWRAPNSATGLDVDSSWPINDGSNKASDSVAVIRRSLVRFQDFVSNPRCMWETLKRQHEDARREFEEIQSHTEALRLRVSDFLETPLISPDAAALKSQMDRIAEQDSSASGHARIGAFLRFPQLLSGNAVTFENAAPSAVFYLLLRCRVVMALLASCHSELQSEPHMLLGQVIPFSPNVAAAIEAMCATAAHDPVTRDWRLPDVVDMFSDRMARVLSDRFRETLSILTHASMVVFVDCCVARIFHLFSHPDDFRPDDRAATEGDVTWLLSVSAVEQMERVDLFDTLAKVKKIYLNTTNSRWRLSEPGVYAKSALRDACGSIFVGTPETHGSNVMHHRGQKYGSLNAFPNEITRKGLLEAADDWSVTVAPQRSKRSFLFFGGTSTRATRVIPPMIKPPPSTASEGAALHWSSCLVSVGPRCVGANEVIRTTVVGLSQEGGDGHVFIPAAVRQHARCFAVNGDGTVAQSVALTVDGAPPPIASSRVEAATALAPFHVKDADCTIVTEFRCATAGVVVMGVEYEGVLLLGNHVVVRAGPVDWPSSCTMEVHPETSVAGELVTVTLTLRDSYGNPTSATDPNDFSVTVDNDGAAVTASPIVELSEGRYQFWFTPTAEGPVSVTVTGAGCEYSYPRSLVCSAAATDFKNSVFSLDEWNVEAGTSVTGTLLLRDVYGNKVEAEDESPFLEMINGVTEVLPVQRVRRGEYMFSCRPLKQGCAIIRATSLRSHSSLITRIHVHAPSAVDWSKSSVSCMSKAAFAGEPVTFQVVTRDTYGNPISHVPSDCLYGWLKYIDADDATNTTRQVDRVRASQAAGGGASYAFTVTPRCVGIAVACVGGGEAGSAEVLMESAAVRIQAASLHWPSTVVHAPRNAIVGEWISVEIDCRDMFDNATEAHPTDFLVTPEHVPETNGSAMDLGNQATVQSKPVCGAGSHFAFQVMCTKSGTLKVAVQFGGSEPHERLIRLEPLPMAWSTCKLSLMPSPSIGTKDHATYVTSATNSISEVPVTVAGESLHFVLEFCDHFGNATSHATQDVVVAVENEGTPLECSAETSHLQSWCSIGMCVRPCIAGRLSITAHVPSDPSLVKQARATVVAGELDWTRCRLECVPHSVTSVVAGSVFTARWQCFDPYDNPVRASLGEVSFSATNAALGNHHPMQGTIEVPIDVRNSGANELLLHCVPEVSGKLTVDVRTAAGDVNTGHSVDVEVRPAPLDWIGRTVLEVATDGEITAGTPFAVRLRACDVHGNPVTMDEKEVQVELEEAPLTQTHHPSHRDAASPETNEGWSLHDASTGEWRHSFSAYRAGCATVRFVLVGSSQSRALSVSIAPARVAWRNTVLRWPAPTTVASVAADCSVLWFDAYGNRTTAGVPPLASLSSTFMLHPLSRILESSLRESVSRGGDGHPFPDCIEAGTPTSLAMPSSSTIPFVTDTAGDVVVSLQHVGEEASVSSAVLTVVPGSVSWGNTTFDLIREAPHRAGDPVDCVLSLRDRFSNHAVGIRSIRDDLRAQIVHGASNHATGNYSITPCTDGISLVADASHFLLSFTPTAVGDYTVSLGSSHESETCDLMLRVIVEPSQVAWDSAHTKLFTDAESVSAGGTYFTTLECCDAFGNPSDVGIHLGDICYDVQLLPQLLSTSEQMDDSTWHTVRPNTECEAVGVTFGNLVALPQQKGLYGMSVEVRRAGTMRLQAVLGTNGGAVSCEMPVDVIPAAPSWVQCSLEAGVPLRPLVTGCDAWFGVTLRDKFRNVIYPSPLLPSTSGAANSTTHLHSSRPTADAHTSHRDESQDDLTEDLAAAGRGGGDAFHLALRDVILHELLPLLRAKCTNVAPDSAKDITCTIFHVGNDKEFMETLSRVSSEADGLQGCCILLSASPVLAYSSVMLSVELADVEASLLDCSLDGVVPGGVSTVELISPNDTNARLSFTAGTLLELRLRLRDRYGNWIRSDSHISECVTRGFKVLSDPSGIALTVSEQAADVQADGLVCVQGHGSRSGSYRIVCYGPDMEVLPWYPLSLSGTDASQRFVDVTPSSISATHTTICAAPEVEQSLAAGEPFLFDVALRDPFGNAIDAEAAAPLLADTHQGPSLSCVNGRGRPSATLVGARGRHVLRFSVCPEERTALQITLTDELGGSFTLPAIHAVLPAPLHWPSCIVKIADTDGLTVGSETTILIRGRDRFGNSIDIDSSDLRVEVVVGDQCYHLPGDDEDPRFPISALSRPLPDCEGFHLPRHKELVLHLRTPLRGKMQCRVYFKGIAQPILSNPVEVS